MKEKVIDLLEKMEDSGYKFEVCISKKEIVLVQKTLNLKGLSDDDLYDLWNHVDEICGDLLDEAQKTNDMHMFNLIRDYHITILEIINQSKSFKTGILY